MTDVWLFFIAAGIFLIAYIGAQGIAPAMNRIAKALEGGGAMKFTSPVGAAKSRLVSPRRAPGPQCSSCAR